MIFRQQSLLSDCFFQGWWSLDLLRQAKSLIAQNMSGEPFVLQILYTSMLSLRIRGDYWGHVTQGNSLLLLKCKLPWVKKKKVYRWIFLEVMSFKYQTHLENAWILIIHKQYFTCRSVFFRWHSVHDPASVVSFSNLTCSWKCITIFNDSYLVQSVFNPNCPSWLHIFLYSVIGL